MRLLRVASTPPLLQVELFAEFEAKRLMQFLVSSQSYSLESAYEICTARGLVSEQVFILGRMGNATKALHLIIEQLNNIPQVGARCGTPAESLSGLPSLCVT